MPKRGQDEFSWHPYVCGWECLWETTGRRMHQGASALSHCQVLRSKLGSRGERKEEKGGERRKGEEVGERKV